MAKYKITFKRWLVEYGSVIVEADDESDAVEEAREKLDGMDTEWTEPEFESEEHEDTEEII